MKKIYFFLRRKNLKVGGMTLDRHCFGIKLTILFSLQENRPPFKKSSATYKESSDDGGKEFLYINTEPTKSWI